MTTQTNKQEVDIGILDNEAELLKTSKMEAIGIINFLIGYHDLNINEVDFEK